MTTIRHAAKRAGELALAHCGAAQVARRGHRDAVLVLTYHNIVPTGFDTGGGERSLHLELDAFVRQMDALAETHDVVPVKEILADEARAGRRPRAVVTFDDAYRGAVTLGVEVLARLGLPATLFATPGLLGDVTFWWDALAATTGGVMPEHVRAHALMECDGEDARVRAWAAARELRLAEAAPEQRSATVDELIAASRVPGITVGAHGWSHAVMPRLADGALRRELQRPVHWLLARIDTIVPVLSVPYGLSSPRLEWAARRSGYAAMFPGDAGWFRPTAGTQRPYLLPRRTISAGVSPERFALLVSGALR